MVIRYDRPGSVNWLHRLGYEGDAERARAVWKRIQDVARVGDHPFTTADWHAQSNAGQQTKVQEAVTFCELSERERMTVEASEEAKRLRRFIP